MEVARANIQNSLRLPSITRTDMRRMSFLESTPSPMRSSAVAPNPSAGDNERAGSHLDHPWPRLDACIYTRVIRVFPYFGLTRSHHVDVIADNVCVCDQGETAHGGHQIWFSKSLSGPDVRLPFYFIALALQHTAQISECCVVPCVLRIARYEAMLKHMVDAFWHTAPGATAACGG